MEGIGPQHGHTTTAGTPTTKAALSSQLFKDPECWSVQGSNPRSPARWSNIQLTELTDRRLSTRRLPQTANSRQLRVTKASKFTFFNLSQSFEKLLDKKGG